MEDKRTRGGSAHREADGQGVHDVERIGKGGNGEVELVEGGHAKTEQDARQEAQAPQLLGPLVLHTRRYKSPTLIRGFVYRLSSMQLTGLDPAQAAGADLCVEHTQHSAAQQVSASPG